MVIAELLIVLATVVLEADDGGAMKDNIESGDWMSLLGL
jgi:hypothetical protein